MHRSRSFFWSLAMCLLTCACIVVLHVWSPSTVIQASDVLLRWHAEQQTPDPRIVVIDIDETSLALLSDDFGRWPWPRAVYGTLIEGLAEHGSKHVLMDILFSEPDYAQPDSDAYFAEVLEQYPHVSLAILKLPEGLSSNQIALTSLQPFAAKSGNVQGSGYYLLPRALPPAVWRGGIINALQDPDGTLRRYNVTTEDQGWQVLSLPAAALHQEKLDLPLRQNILLNWQGTESVPHTRYSLHEVIDAFNGEKNRVDLTRLNQSWVVIGSTAAGLFDYKPTPMKAYFPALTIVTTALDNLLNQEWLKETSLWVSIVAGLLSTLLLVRIKSESATWPLGIWVISSLFLWVFAVAQISLNTYWLWLPPVLATGMAALCTSGLRAIEQQQAKQRAISTFNRFLDPRVVKHLIEDGKTPDQLPGERRQVTVLFSDIRGFTSLSENTDPEQIVTLLNAYFENQVNVIFKHGGTLDKFIGDAIMAFWGAPEDDANHAARAVAAALDMEQGLAAFKAAHDLPDFDIGIGIHSGEAVVAFLGSSQRRDYTVIGDTVNSASRLEGLTKNRSRILVSEQTVQACADAFHFEPMGEESVKGREQRIKIFRPSVDSAVGDQPAS